MAIPKLVKGASEQDITWTGALSLWPAVALSEADVPSAQAGHSGGRRWGRGEEGTWRRRGNRGRGNGWLAAHNFLGALVHGLFPPLWESVCCLPMLG